MFLLLSVCVNDVAMQNNCHRNIIITMGQSFHLGRRWRSFRQAKGNDCTSRPVHDLIACWSWMDFLGDNGIVWSGKRGNGDGQMNKIRQAIGIFRIGVLTQI